MADSEPSGPYGAEGVREPALIPTAPAKQCYEPGFKCEDHRSSCKAGAGHENGAQKLRLRRYVINPVSFERRYEDRIIC